MTDPQCITSASGAGTSPADGSDGRVRAHTYALLALLMSRPPADSLVSQLARIEVPDEVADIPLAKLWRQLQEAAGRARVPELDDEFHALFIGVARGELMPYGSWYMTGFVMDKPLVALRQDLMGLGIQRREGNKEPEDHAAALCETMALLADPQDPAAIDIQRHLFERHVGSWLEILFRDMQHAESADFYRAVGALGEAFIKLERTYLAMSG